MKFVNRINELSRLTAIKEGLVVLFGRRRVGKTSLIEKWRGQHALHYSQAIESVESLQIEQLCNDLSQIIPSGLKPRSWQELLSVLSLVQTPATVVLDEFPYLVKSSPSLPSILQRWVDHEMPHNVKLMLLGSSQTMMHRLFMQSSSPLYERAKDIIHIEPMGYADFCEALGIKKNEIKNFSIYSLVGGVPKYWELIDPENDADVVATKLFFQKAARLEFEPDRLLSDEDISGQQAKSIFEAIGRGACRPSEIASRIGIKQTSLSKPLQMLRHASLIEREGPFPDGSREAKRSLYKISDFALRFWYRVYSPHRSRWHLYSKKQKQTLIHEHTSTVLEDCYRVLFKDARRYWEGKDIEIDSVRYLPQDLSALQLAEIKNTKLTQKERIELESKLKHKFFKSTLSDRYQLGKIEVLDVHDILERL